MFSMKKVLSLNLKVERESTFPDMNMEQVQYQGGFQAKFKL